MATTVIDICNAALTELEMQPVSSIDDEASATAVVLKSVVYASIRDVLRAHPWSCAAARALIPAAAAKPAFGWARSFPLPVDCLFVRQVDDGLYPYEIEGRSVLTDGDGPLRLIYTRDLTIDPATGREITSGEVLAVDPGVANAAAFRIAARVARKLTGAATAAAEMRDLYRAALNAAAAYDAMEAKVPARTESEYLSEDL